MRLWFHAQLEILRGVINHILKFELEVFQEGNIYIHERVILSPRQRGGNRVGVKQSVEHVAGLAALWLCLSLWFSPLRYRCFQSLIQFLRSVPSLFHLCHVDEGYGNSLHFIILSAVWIHSDDEPLAVLRPDLPLHRNQRLQYLAGILRDLIVT